MSNEKREAERSDVFAAALRHPEIGRVTSELMLASLVDLSSAVEAALKVDDEEEDD
jgi:hypothetical protein